MDSILVVDERFVFRRKLEQQLLDALQFIFRTGVLSTFKAQLTAMAEFAISVLLLKEWQTVSSSWESQVIDALAFRIHQPRIAHSFSTVPESASAHAWIAEALSTNNIKPPISIDTLLDTLQERSELPLLAVGYPLNQIECLYLCHRLKKISGTRHASENDQIKLKIHWPDDSQFHAYGEIYELTHAVFYLSDFGSYTWRTGRNALLTDQATVLASLHQAAELCLKENHLDLVGELALACLCLDPCADVAPLLCALRDAQRSDGAIPLWRGARGIPGTYHATLIALLAFSKQYLGSPGGQDCRPE